MIELFLERVKRDEVKRRKEEDMEYVDKVLALHSTFWDHRS